MVTWNDHRRAATVASACMASLGAVGVISPSMHMVDIGWPETWVMPGDCFEHEFNTAFPEIQFVGATLTKGGVEIGTVDAQGVGRQRRVA